MGSWLAVLATSCACSCCTALTSSVFGCCGSAAKKHSVIGRVLYAVIFVLFAVLAWVLRNLPFWINSVSYFHWIPGFSGCSNSTHPLESSQDTILSDVSGFVPEGICYGTMSVYRVTAAVAVFHFFMFAVMINVNTKKDPRSSLQHSWWSIKILLLLALLVAIFFIPNFVFIGYGWVALVGSILFILIQLILLVDFAHSWNESWVANYEESGNCWLGMLLTSTILMYGLSLTLTVLMYLYFRENTTACWMNTMFTSVNLVVTLIISLCSIHPKVHEKNPRSGLLQSSVVTLYATYLVWSALASEPAEMKCSSFDIFGLGASTVSGSSLFLGIAFTFLALVYAAVRVGSSADDLTATQTSHLKSGARTKIIDDPDAETPTNVELDDGASESESGEEKSVTYNYSFFHFTFFLAALYLSMVLTNWETVSSAGEHSASSVSIDQGMAAVWVKVVSSWVVLALYLWTTIAPLLFPDRRFY